MVISNLDYYSADYFSVILFLADTQSAPCYFDEDGKNDFQNYNLYFRFSKASPQLSQNRAFCGTYYGKSVTNLDFKFNIIISIHQFVN